AVAAVAGFDGAERQARLRGGGWAGLVGRVDFEFDASAGARFAAGLEGLVIFMHHVVDRRLRQLHGELLRARRRGGERAARRNCDESAGETGDDRVHFEFSSLDMVALSPWPAGSEPRSARGPVPTGSPPKPRGKLSRTG